MVYRDKQSYHRPVIDVRASWVRGVSARTCKGSRFTMHHLRYSVSLAWPMVWVFLGHHALAEHRPLAAVETIRVRRTLSSDMTRSGSEIPCKTLSLAPRKAFVCRSPAMRADRTFSCKLLYQVPW